MFLDTVNVTNRMHNKVTDFDYLTLVKVVEKVNTYFSKVNIHPLTYKFKTDFNDQFAKGRKLLGLYWARLFIVYMDSL